MPEKLSPKPRPTYCRVPSRRRLRPPKPIIGRAYSKTRTRNQPRRPLSRSASEPILYTAQFGVTSPNQDVAGETDRKHHTFTDGGSFFSSSPSLLPPLPSPPPCPNFMEEAKVVVSVTVEGSPGPVRAMVKLGATVDETIGAVVSKYKREGRSPRLDWERDDSFELHQSHFSLQSLNKSAKIGEVGGRSFYLRQSSSHSSFNSAGEGRDTAGGGEAELLHARFQTVPPPPAHLFLSFIATRFSKIKRRTRRLWSCITCV